MKNLFLSFLVLAMPFFSLAQSDFQPQPIKSNQKPWTSLEANTDNFQFVVVTDRTGGPRPGVFQKGVRKINLLQPEFVVSVGDLIEGYTENTEEINRQWREFQGWVSKFQMPFFYVAGNHDYTNEVMAQSWREKFGVEYYYFLYKDVLFLCLNSEDGATALINPDLGEPQFNWAKEVLSEHKNVRWTMVFMHQPLWIRDGAENWRKLEKVLDGRKHSVFTGHVHRYTLYERNKSDYFTLATMGGGSGLRGKNYGEFDHFMWITMTEEGPYYANVMLDGIEDKTVYTEAQLAQARTLDADPPIRLEPLFVGEKPVESLSFQMKNPDSVARKVMISLRNSSYLKAVNGATELTLGPGEEKQVSVPVRMEGAVDKKARPMRARVEFLGDDYVWNRNYYAYPNEVRSIPTATQAIELDGDLSDWAELPFQFSDQDPKDAQVSFAIQQTEDMIYLGAKVIDQDIRTGFGLGAFGQDGLFLSVDGRPLAESAYNPREIDEAIKGKWIAMIAQPSGNSFGLEYKMFLPKGAKGKGKKTADGYTVEYAIPVRWLDEKQGKSWENLRINLTLIDMDEGDEDLQPLHWVPDWARGHVGTGTFFRK